MTFDLPGLVQHVSRLMLLGSGICATVAVVTFLVSSSGQPDHRHEDAVIVLGTLAAIQAVNWFGLTYWATFAARAPETGPGDRDGL